jgi:dephospho-CoA kinase
MGRSREDFPGGGSGDVVVALVGMCGAGKSEVARYLERKGWRVVHFGQLTMRELCARGMSITEENERSVREGLREQHGPDAYARLLLPEIVDGLAQDPTVVDGLYSWAEYRFLRNQLGRRLFVVALFTPRMQRYRRLAARPHRPLSMEQAEERDFAEIEHLQKGGPIAIADYTLINSGSRDDLFGSVDELVNAILAHG